MGIKPTYIKTLSEELLAKHGNRFGKDFEENKQAVSEVTVIESKRVRNRVAGNITRRVNRKKHR
ncbi:MAG: 30S ribosomal protein S17e [Methanomicrobiaceae archaeon]|nr:30S ribosomal protein S17e [Methanomicrobiaceae archaeon]